ncbi:hypothetical protein [Nocardia suismassiliense]|uniref:hypothetical protein n=1 Tax=Nocardia suismassiliense TaxID=2077092 RepID=UPI0018FE3B54|nr:hypothetical protein [Nocardia suismassiliense]
MFDPEAARAELRVIAEELRCDAVRITGDDPERLTAAAQHAADAGLEVWFSPFPCELTPEQLSLYFADCAERAEAVGAQVFVAGCELSLFGSGFLPGPDTLARIETFNSNDLTMLASMAEANAQINTALADATATVRKRFRGKLTYAAGTWEDIDWTPFDIIGIDAYGDPSHPAYREGLAALQRLGKPIAVTEVGCCTYRGAAQRGGMGWDIIDYDTEPPRIQDGYTRDEDEPVRYMGELFAFFEAERVDTAFWHTFASYHLPHHPNPQFDTDLASFGVRKVLPDNTLVPKHAYKALADICSRSTTQT